MRRCATLGAVIHSGVTSTRTCRVRRRAFRGMTALVRVFYVTRIIRHFAVGGDGAARVFERRDADLKILACQHVRRASTYDLPLKDLFSF